MWETGNREQSRRRWRKDEISPMGCPRLILLGLVLLMLPHPSIGRLSFFMSYTTMIGLAGQSSRWKQSMESELSQATEKVAQATGWQEAAAEDQSTSETLAEKSIAEEEQGTMLQEESASLAAEAKQDQAKAATEEQEADGLVAQAAANQAESDTLLADAAAEEVVAEEDTVKATEEASLAADDAAAAEVDEAAAAGCQLLPVIDVVCDVVGGVAALGLESASARYATMAAENFAAATAAQSQADAATAQATDLQAQAAEEGEEAEALQSDAAVLESRAQEELAESELDEAAANKAFEQSALDENAADGEEAKSVAEEDASTKAWSESVQHGASACGSAVMMSVASGFAMLFWAVRIGGSAVIPLIGSIGRTLSSVVQNGTTGLVTLICWHSSSHIFHHALLFVVNFGIWGGGLLHLRQVTSIKTMGGILLGFSVSLATTQTLLMHVLAKALQGEATLLMHLWTCTREFLRRMPVFTLLVLLEILLLWVNASVLFVPGVIQLARSWWVWLILAVTIGMHHVCFSKSTASSPQGAEETGASAGTGDGEDSIADCSFEDDEHPSETTKCNANARIGSVVDYGSSQSTVLEDEDTCTTNEDEWEPIDCESEPLLVVSSNHPANEAAISSVVEMPTTHCKEKWFHELVIDDCKTLRLLLLFELLMASIMIALFRQSAPLLVSLWPTSKEILLASWPHWQFTVGACVVIGFGLLVCACPELTLG